ncbi:hypothetical protein FBEOM_8275 [Fusarium beomiforme]|uniref:Uncharacterized protein n=1 Tax=Fusarium beomiforme TaxID=44412 RepID=A0A9P5AFY3_9HYPO|nr:hypothetical protein FBEOM_8275 [Fusarium beomiforme]
MLRFVSDPYVPVSARLQDPLYVPGSYIQDNASLDRFTNRPRPHSSTGFEGIGAQFIGTWGGRNMWVRILLFGTMPAIFGLTITNRIISSIPGEEER